MAEQAGDRLVKFLGTGESSSRTTEEPLLTNSARGNEFSSIVPSSCSRAAVEHYVRHEWARHLDDVLVRRCRRHYYHADTDAQARCVAGWRAELLNWTPETVEQEFERYHALVDHVASDTTRPPTTVG